MCSVRTNNPQEGLHNRWAERLQRRKSLRIYELIDFLHTEVCVSCVSVYLFHLAYILVIIFFCHNHNALFFFFQAQLVKSNYQLLCEEKLVSYQRKATQSFEGRLWALWERYELPKGHPDRIKPLELLNKAKVSTLVIILLLIHIFNLLSFQHL